MNPKESDDEDRKCPHCRTIFSTVGVKNRHIVRNVCQRSQSVPPARSSRTSRTPEPPAILLNEDHESLLVGHTCPYSKYICNSLVFIFTISNVRYRLCQLLNLTNSEVYPPLSSCTIPGGVDVCPTTDTHRVRLEVLLAARAHGVNQISVPKTGSTIGLLVFLFHTFLTFSSSIIWWPGS